MNDSTSFDSLYRYVRNHPRYIGGVAWLNSPDRKLKELEDVARELEELDQIDAARATRKAPVEPNGSDHDPDPFDPGVSAEDAPIAKSRPKANGANGHAEPAPKVATTKAKPAAAVPWQKQLRAAMLDYGLETPPEDFIADGKFHDFRSRSGQQKPKGWYVVHADEVMVRWTFGDWTQNDDKNSSKDRRSGHTNPSRKLTAKEKAEYRVQQREASKHTRPRN